MANSRTPSPMPRRGLAALIVGCCLTIVLAGCSEQPPVSAPAPTNAVSATASPATSYNRDANAALEALASNSSSVADVMAKADLASASWRTTLSTRLDALVQVDAQARTLKPGASDAEVHQRLLEITADFSRAAQLIRTGIDPVNVENLDQAAQILNAGVAKVAALRATLPLQ